MSKPDYSKMTKEELIGELHRQKGYVEMTVVRKYTHGGIEVCVEIDRHKRTARLVEYDTDREAYVTKKWVFADRQAGYVSTWIKIMAAMSYATEQALNELREIEDEATDKTARMMAAASGICPDCAEKDGKHLPDCRTWVNQ